MRAVVLDASGDPRLADLPSPEPSIAVLASGARPWERLLTHEVGLEGVAALFADPPRDYPKAVVQP